MKKRLFSLAFAVLLCIVLSNLAQATVLTYNICMDDSFVAYLSTTKSDQGIEFASGDTWATTTSGTVNLISGHNYYIHIYGLNYNFITQRGFLGDFSLNGTDFLFANNTTNLLTNTTDWQGNDSYWNNSVTLINMGANGDGPWGPKPLISNNAIWIWSLASPSVSYFTAEIIAVSTPEPSTCMLLGIGGLAITYMKRRKSTRAA
jgi:hypothetical protein